MLKKFKPKLTLFHCIHAFGDTVDPGLDDKYACEIKTIKMACSSMVKDVFLLRAFEAGADGVIVMVCPQGRCRYLEGNLRAEKRVGWVRHLLDEIGLDGRRLLLSNIAPGDHAALNQTMDRVLEDLAALGPNPAA
jgi:F420-non-reducing hydrogenase iron-sulfur subunit